MDHDIKRGWTRRSDVVMQYVPAGEAKPVVLLPGWPQT